MRILVYGAGVIGCELAHLLNTPKNDVVLLARGEWRHKIEENGLIIKHSGYFHTTVDRLSVIDTLTTYDYYDIIFVIMTYQNVINIIPDLRKNSSKNIVFIGNNASPEQYEQMINQDLFDKKEVLYGFTGIGGERQSDKIISMHPLNISLRIGGLESYPSNFCMNLIKRCFLETNCNVEWEENLKGWLLTHLAYILPTTYICYNQNFNLWKTNLTTMNLMLDAVNEAYLMLKSNGYQIRPEHEDEQFIMNRKKELKKLIFLMKTPAGKFVISNHCKHGVHEMTELDHKFEKLRSQSNIPMPSWDALRNLCQPAKEQKEVSTCI